MKGLAMLITEVLRRLYPKADWTSPEATLRAIDWRAVIGTVRDDPKIAEIVADVHEIAVSARETRMRVQRIEETMFGDRVRELLSEAESRLAENANG